MRASSKAFFLVGASLLFVACGSSGGGNAAPFVGTWTYDSTSSVTPMNCTIPIVNTPLDPTPVSLAGQQVTLSMGADPSHLQYSEGTTCNISFSVSGMTATAASGQTCTFTFENYPVMVSISAWVLILSGDQISDTFSGSAALGGPSCTASGSGTLQRNASDASAGG